MTCAAIVLAAGAGRRADPGETGAAKQFRNLAGRSVLARALDPFLDHPEIGPVQVVLRRGTQAAYARAVAPHPRLLAPIIGGERRQDSVRIALDSLVGAAPDLVLIHDAARPFASGALISRVVEALASHRAVVPGLAVGDTLKRIAASGHVAETVPRDGLYAVQTPQGFAYREILAAHRRAAATALTFTDDAAVAEWNGLSVALVDGEARNRKLTTPEDFQLAGRLFRTETRIGSGFDVHRFGPGDHVMLCGVRIPHSYGLLGHSDADVGLHALTDALLGSIASGDIGSHFPPTDPQWRGADSADFLRRARDLTAEIGGRLVNVDVTLICEAPRVSPHREAMRARLADILELDVARVAVKGTTSERLGFTGRGEGIAAQAVVAVALPAMEADDEIE